MMPSLQLLFTETRFAAMVETLDALHSAASEGRVRDVSPLTHAELIGWLYEVVYTAQETLAEIEGEGAGEPHEWREPALRVIRHSEAS